MGKLRTLDTPVSPLQSPCPLSCPLPRPAPLALKIVNPCPSCGAELTFKLSLGGDEEGRFMTSIYQCPKCKEIEVR